MAYMCITFLLFCLFGLFCCASHALILFSLIMLRSYLSLCLVFPLLVSLAWDSLPHEHRFAFSFSFSSSTTSIYQLAFTLYSAANSAISS
jgi:hypothetical protein